MDLNAGKLDKGWGPSRFTFVHMENGTTINKHKNKLCFPYSL